MAGSTAAPVRPVAAIRTLGRFEVLVGGPPVAASAWQSRKARDLLRLLVARRGRAAHREELAELLWADERGRAAPTGAGIGLATALSIVRGILDGDRPESVVLADGGERRARHRPRPDRPGDVPAPGRARPAAASARARRGGHALLVAERLYTGDFLEGEAYEDWAAAPREQARATYLHVVRTIADEAAPVRRHHEAIRHLLRVLAMDAYDERGHLDWSGRTRAAGRHGEARRARAATPRRCVTSVWIPLKPDEGRQGAGHERCEDHQSGLHLAERRLIRAEQLLQLALALGGLTSLSLVRDISDREMPRHEGRSPPAQGGRRRDVHDADDEGADRSGEDRRVVPGSASRPHR